MKTEERAAAIRRRLGLDELLLRPMDKESDSRRLPRSTPGMRDFLKYHWVEPDGSPLVVGKLQYGPYKKPKSKPRPYNA